MDEVRWLKERLDFDYRVAAAFIFRENTTKRVILFQFRFWPWNGTYDSARSEDTLLAVPECIQNSTIADHDDV